MYPCATMRTEPNSADWLGVLCQRLCARNHYTTVSSVEDSFPFTDPTLHAHLHLHFPSKMNGKPFS